MIPIWGILMIFLEYSGMIMGVIRSNGDANIFSVQPKCINNQYHPAGILCACGGHSDCDTILGAMNINLKSG